MHTLWLLHYVLLTAVGVVGILTVLNGKRW